MNVAGATNLSASASAVSANANQKAVSMGKLISLGSTKEKWLLYLGWFFSFLTGAVLPAFIFLMGDVFDAHKPEADKDEALKKVTKVVVAMGGLGVVVFISSALQHSLLSSGALLVSRRIKRAYI